MARRRKKQASDLELRLKAPWVIFAGFSVVILIASQFVTPLIFAAHPVTALIGRGVIPLGLVTSILLGLIAAGLYFKQRNAPVAPKWTKGVSPYSIESKRLDGQPAPDTRPFAPEPLPTEWSNELLCRMEGRRIEKLVAAYFREKTFRTETMVAGSHCGSDIKLFTKNKATPFAIVKCTVSNTQEIGVQPVRELLYATAREAVAKSIHVTTGAYAQDAIEFAKENAVKLISGDMLLKGILALTADAQRRLLDMANDAVVDASAKDSAP